jgi:hypothetical protein
MKTATALTITAIGAIFAFAITASPSFLNLQIVGWVLIATGICGLVIPRRGRGWLRRTVLVKGSPDFTNGDHAESAATAAVVHADTDTDATAEQRTDGPIEHESVVEYIEK